MKLATILESQKEQITQNAAKEIGLSPVSHYCAIDESEKIERISQLFRTVKSCIEKRDVTEMLEYSRKLAKDRFEGEFPLHDLNAVFNTLEEIIWRKITEQLEPSEYADAFGLVSTVFCLGKEILAKEYITLTIKAASSCNPVLDLS